MRFIKDPDLLVPMWIERRVVRIGWKSLSKLEAGFL